LHEPIVRALPAVIADAAADSLRAHERMLVPAAID